MKFDTIIIVLIVFVIGFLFYLAKDYERDGSFISTVQESLGLKEPDNTPKPEDTLVAPFAEDNVKPIQSSEGRQNVSLPVNQIDIDKPHRSIRHIGQWLVQHVGNALILDKEKISNLNTEIAPSFSSEGLENYKEFGKVTNIFSAVFHGDETTLTSYVKEDPLFISSATPGGVYQWVYEVPVVLSLVKGTLSNYRSTKAEQQLKEIFFCITVKRDNAANDDGLIIDAWKSGRCTQ